MYQYHDDAWSQERPENLVRGVSVVEGCGGEHAVAEYRSIHFLIYHIFQFSHPFSPFLSNIPSSHLSPSLPPRSTRPQHAVIDGSIDPSFVASVNRGVWCLRKRIGSWIHSVKYWLAGLPECRSCSVISICLEHQPTSTFFPLVGLFPVDLDVKGISLSGPCLCPPPFYDPFRANRHRRQPPGSYR